MGHILVTVQKQQQMIPSDFHFQSIILSATWKWTERREELIKKTHGLGGLCCWLWKKKKGIQKYIGDEICEVRCWDPYWESRRKMGKGDLQVSCWYKCLHGGDIHHSGTWKRISPGSKDCKVCVGHAECVLPLRFMSEGIKHKIRCRDPQLREGTWIRNQSVLSHCT